MLLSRGSSLQFCRALIYGNPHELPTLVLYRKYHVEPAFPAGPDSVSFKDYRKQTQISRERVSQLIQV